MKTIITMTTFSHDDEWIVYKLGIYGNQYWLHSTFKGLGWFPSECETEKKKITVDQAKEYANDFLRAEANDEGVHRITNQKLLNDLLGESNE